ncbi:helix-turn-helix domain-containing protein [Halorubrum sp. HHNYT27]|uniref:helix-turn-helix domain-containing protein n=1 Tax=Halorubrum sp. HHNYT27 TaxID=3402275 RepID=UPI003EBD18D4
MSVHVNITVPAEHFAFESLPEEVRIELERCVPFDAELSPYLWLSGADDSRYVGEATELAGVDLVGEVDGEHLVRARWPPERPDVFGAIAASEAICLAGFRDRGVWNLTLRFPSTASVSEWYRTCPRSGESVTIRQIQTGPGCRTDRVSKLTDRQREALRVALETGYFAVPRETSLEGISTRLNISDTAASQRLRRGIENLIIDRFGDLRP